MVLPADAALPPYPYLFALVTCAAILVGLLIRERPRVTEPVVLAFTPWMVVGATLHVLYQVGAAPASIAPLFGTPTVYVSVAVVALAAWLAARRLTATPARALGGAGLVVAIVSVSATLVVGGVVRLAVPIGALVIGVFLGGGVWALVARFRRDELATTGPVGQLVLVAHAVDGVSTAVGVDVLGFGERTPASLAILELASALPTADVVGVGWLFVLVKVAIASAVIVLFAEYVREAPTRGYALLGIVAAVGLGPGVHNLLLFAVYGT